MSTLMNQVVKMTLKEWSKGDDQIIFEHVISVWKYCAHYEIVYNYYPYWTG